MSSDTSDSECPTEDFQLDYRKAEEYWSKVPATVNGMLGGFESVSSVDILGSSKFLNSLHAGGYLKSFEKALDCGAGIGRVTKLLLLPLFTKVDMVEVTQAFLDQSIEYIGPDAGRVGERFCRGLQDFQPPEATYDLIWCQWVLGHLTDAALVNFFRACGQALRSVEGCAIVLKENVCSQGEIFDEEDNSVTRSWKSFLHLIQEADMDVLMDVRQDDFPPELYSVRMIAFRPMKK